MMTISEYCRPVVRSTSNLACIISASCLIVLSLFSGAAQCKHWYYNKHDDTIYEKRNGKWQEVVINLPTIVVTAPRDRNNLDAGYFWRFDGPPEYDEYEYYDPYSHRRWWYDPILEEWNEFEQAYGPTPKVYLDLVSGSKTIDPTESSRKRYLKIRTDPPFPGLAITKITKTRKTSPSYGHSHAVDNNNSSPLKKCKIAESWQKRIACRMSVS